MSARARSTESRLATEARARTSRSTDRATRWGGARAGAGRPRKGPIASEPHKTRPTLQPRHPVHIAARVLRPTAHLLRPTNARGALPSARQGRRGFTRADLKHALRRALTLSLARADFRIIHLAIAASRIELVVEADDKLALARGMQGFQVSAAKTINRLARRRGTVFPDRYRMRILRTRVEVRAVVGGLAVTRTNAWPHTWLLRVELLGRRSSAQRYRGTARPRRRIRSRADEDS